MKKNCFSLILVLLCCNSFAQSKDKIIASKSITSDKPNSKPAPEAVNISADSAVKSQTFEKNPFPQNEKAAPATFYVENDKPCDRRTYMRHLKQATPKN